MFKVGDKITIGESHFKGTILENDNVYPDCEYVLLENGQKLHYAKSIIKKEKEMTQYEELKQRIEALDNGWDKEADDIIQEIGEGYAFSICCVSNEYALLILSETTRGWSTMGEKKTLIPVKDFAYNTQCEKLEAFKKALIWLLDNSDIKDEKKDKIEVLEKKIDELKEEVRKLK